MKKPLTAAVRLLLLLALVAPFSSALALDTSFTYQGRLNNGSGPANGLYDFQFALSNAPSGGSQIGSTVTSLNVGVTNGLFTTTLDFGSVFTGQAAWLAIGVRTNGGSTYAGLTPLQPLTPTPYAVFANSASNVSGTINASLLTSGGNGNSGSSGNFFVGSAGNAATTGSYNTALGEFSLGFNSVGTANTTVGQYALGLNTNGVDNTVVGSAAMKFNVNGSQNTAVGSHAFINAGSGSHNIALGASAGSGVGDGSYNIEIGSQGANGDDHIIRIGDVQTNALIAGVITGNGGGLTNLSVIGSTVTSVGNGNSGSKGNFFLGSAGDAATTGSYNTALGNLSLEFNSSGGGNTAVGFDALILNTGGSENTVMGHDAMSANGNGSQNTAIGSETFFDSSGSHNIGLGAFAGFNVGSGSYNIEIGNQGASGDDHIIRIGDVQTSTFLAGVIYGNGGGLTNLNVANVSGAALLSGGNTFAGNQTVTGTVAANSFSGSGTGLTGVALTGSANTFSADQTVNGQITAGGSVGAMTLLDRFHAVNGFGWQWRADATGLNASRFNGGAGSQFFTISTNGQFGIGTTAPVKSLEVSGAAAGVASGGSVESSIIMRLDNTSSDGNVSSPDMVGIGFGQNSTRQAIVGGTFGNDVLDFYTGGTLTAPKMRIDFSGRVGIGVLTLTHPLDMASGAFCSVAGAWTSVSDRNVKENFTTISPAEILSKVTAMPITEWKYKAEPDGTEHIGPMAQDFHAAFGLNGADDKHISSIDEDGVALAAIQGLNQKLNEKCAEIQTLKAQNDSLVARLDKLEVAMRQLAANR